ncbi:MAG: glycosyl hydrolase family 79 C-terminal domain-containing protein [Acidobacteriaceae bacterium]|nr:glycosyl hydrolase family 79 C-terminal domain-containing protein [Acidobacteriaceae bacterium]
MPHQLFKITPQAIDTLASFLHATGWSAIYGLNFGNSTPERAATEAEYVAKTLGEKLAFFQIGNEPDFYRDANNGTRPAGWGFEDYVKEWVAYADAVSARVPEARFGGPDTGASSDWVVRFGEEVAPQLGNRLIALSGHYYAEGPPNDPRVTTARLLAGDPQVIRSTQEIMRVADMQHLSYHMSEGNSCYRGGKPGMSNAFAASLWAADYLLTLANLGCGGVNLHGGDSRFLSASLGNHNPGLEAAKGEAQAASNGFYTPIASEQHQRASARPVYYGMLFAQQFAGAVMLETNSDGGSQLAVYAAQKQKQTLVALINKSADRNLRCSIHAPQFQHRVRALRLTAPSLNATSGVLFGKTTVSTTERWKPHYDELRSSSQVLEVDLPAASALLLFAE